MRVLRMSTPSRCTLCGKADAAISRLEKTLAAHPNDLDVLQALAAIHSERGQTAEAEKYAERLRKLADK